MAVIQKLQKEQKNTYAKVSISYIILKYRFSTPNFISPFFKSSMYVVYTAFFIFFYIFIFEVTYYRYNKGNINEKN